MHGIESRYRGLILQRKGQHESVADDTTLLVRTFVIFLTI